MYLQTQILFLIHRFKYTVCSSWFCWFTTKARLIQTDKIIKNKMCDHDFKEDIIGCNAIFSSDPIPLLHIQQLI